MYRILVAPVKLTQMTNSDSEDVTEIKNRETPENKVSEINKRKCRTSKERPGRQSKIYDIGGKHVSGSNLIN